MPDIILKNRNGKNIDYPAVKRLRTKKVDGGVQHFGAYDPETLTPEKLAAGETVGNITGTMTVPASEEKTIAPDFSGGDMEVTPGEGAMFSKVTVQQPETLIPENIAEGVDIAGIIGTLAAGGIDLPFHIWSKTITGVDLTSTSSSQNSVQLAAPDEIPEWADLTEIKRVYNFTYTDPIYILGLFLKTGNKSLSVPSYHTYANIMTNISHTSSGVLLCVDVGKSDQPALTSKTWFGALPSNLGCLYVKDGGIYKGAYNGYGGLVAAGTYQLILIKIDPTT